MGRKAFWIFIAISLAAGIFLGNELMLAGLGLLVGAAFELKFRPLAALVSAIQSRFQS